MKLFKRFLMFSTLFLILIFCGKSKIYAEVENTTTTLTLKEFSDVLLTKDAHYPISDEFIEKYQQNSGGYIQLAKKLGKTVNRQLHEPDQKWHFFESWLNQSIEDQTVSWDSDAKSVVYNRLLCPELLLWIYEASGVDPIKVRKAYEQAVIGKSLGTNVSTIAKNMRNCVSWDDILSSIKNVHATSVSFEEDLIEVNVGESIDALFVVNPVGVIEKPTIVIEEENDLISIKQNHNSLSITGIKEGNATIKLSFNENCFDSINVVVVDNRPITIENVEEEIVVNLNDSLKLEPLLSKGIGTFSFEVQNSEILEVSSDGVITTLKEGTTNVLIKSNEHDISKTIKIVVKYPSKALVTLGNHENAIVIINGNLFENSEQFDVGTTINLTVSLNDSYYIKNVLINGEAIVLNDLSYSFVLESNVLITVEALSNETGPSVYNISYDLGTRVTAKIFESNESLFDSFVLSSGDSIILSIANMTYIYGGANGGRGETGWYTGDIIKFGTTSVNGSITFNLSSKVNYVKIIGYVYDNDCQVKIGDSNSSDWSGESADNLTSTYTLSSMNEVDKTIVEAKDTTSIVLSFEETNSLRIDNINKKPLFITSIEFGYDEQYN